MHALCCVLNGITFIGFVEPVLRAFPGLERKLAEFFSCNWSVLIPFNCIILVWWQSCRSPNLHNNKKKKQKTKLKVGKWIYHFVCDLCKQVTD